MTMPNLPLKPLLFVFASALLAGAGCGSPAVPRDLMAEEAHAGSSEDRPVAMKGEGSFDNGQLHVVATVARGFSRGPGKRGTKGGEREHKGWFHKDTDAFSEDYSFDYGDSDEEQKEAVQAYIRQAMARRAAGSPMPPVTLMVTFENKGTQPMEVVPTDVNSDLGNFAVRPPKLSIAPGEKASLDPMISQLGVTNDIIPVTVSVRVGGKTETQVIQVRNILAPAARALSETAPESKK